MTHLVLGIDPSLTATGYAYADTIGVTPRPGATGDRRLRDVEQTLCGLIAVDGPFALAVIEDLPTHGHGAGKTGMAQGVVRLTLIATGIPYVTVPPATLKKYLCGKGNATKADMRMAWFQRTGQDIRNDNCVDALALMAMGMHALGEPLFTVPKAQAAVVEAMAWPLGVRPA